ncbi:hypothetical protein BJ170DRAFT_728101 [Xylariales sp. AK1849]|nr:hypothetical protein BJ170DRAFT_728101 [Xylariales sp. AK1849]
MLSAKSARRSRGDGRRKAHEKSRYGCANCKLKSVKCDETWPSCAECRSFSIRCVYGPRLSPDTLMVEPSFKVDFATPTVRTPPAPLPMSSSYDSSETYQLVPKDILLIEKFQLRTVFTLGSYSSRQNYSEKTLPLAFSSATNLTDPLRSDSPFRLEAGEMQAMVDYMRQIACHAPRLESLSNGFYDLSELSRGSGINPY